MLLIDGLKQLLMLQRLYELVERSTLRTRLLYPILDPLYDDRDDVMRLVFRDEEDRQIHSAFRSLLQLIHKCEFPRYEYYCDILFDIAVEPLEEVVEHPLLPALERQHICVFDDKQQLLLPSFLELFV